MSVLYRVYSNGGTGGPVNLNVPLGTTSRHSYTTPPLAPGSDNTFIVRAYDSVTNVEEANTDARVRIILDASGQDVSARPNAPQKVSVLRMAGGACQVRWAYQPNGEGSPPVGFYVYLIEGTTPGYSNPSATVSYARNMTSYSCVLAGLVNGQPYTVAVRAFNAVAIEPNTSATVSTIADSAPPSNVDALTATPVYGNP